MSPADRPPACARVRRRLRSDQQASKSRARDDRKPRFAARHRAVAVGLAALAAALSITSLAGAWRPDTRSPFTPSSLVETSVDATSQPISRRRDKSAPSAPSSLAVTSAGQTAVSVSWSASKDNVGVAGYGVYVNSRMMKTETQLWSTISGLTCGSGYSLAVDAFDAAGNRSRRASMTVATAACVDTQAPTSPAALRQTAATRDTAVLAWDPSSDNVGVTSYTVYRDGKLVLSTPTPSATLSGLPCGSTLAIAVDAVDAAGNRSQPSSGWVQTAACIDQQPPSPPAGLTITGTTDSSVTLAWSSSTDDVAVAGYGLYRDGSRIATTTQTTATITGLSCNKSYSLAVDAYDAAGNRSSATTISAGTAPCPPPAADTTPPPQPGGLAVVKAATTSIDLSWTASTDNVGVAGYGVYVNGTLAQTANAPAATVSSLGCGAAYTVAVDAFDAAGNRSAKTSVMATTAPCPDTQAPTTPGNLVTTSRTATSIALSWTSSTDNVGVVGYGLYRGGTLVGTTAITTGIFSGLTCGGSYNLAVDSYDAAGNRSAKATLAAATTACPTATVTQSIANGATISGSLIWEAVPGGVMPVSVHFLIDGVDRWTERVCPCYFNGDPDGRLDTRGLSNGPHVFRVESRAADDSVCLLYTSPSPRDS